MMVMRFVAKALVVGMTAGAAFSLSAQAAEQMSPDQARAFVLNKPFAFTCFDGSRGAGRILSDGSVVGTVQFAGQGPVKYARLPSNTIQVRSNSVCASLKGLPFQPCFNLVKNDDASFRGSVSGMGFAYCDFRRHGNSMLMARASMGPRSLHPRSETTGSTTGSTTIAREASAAPKAETKPDTTELRRSTE